MLYISNISCYDSILLSASMGGNVLGLDSKFQNARTTTFGKNVRGSERELWPNHIFVAMPIKVTSLVPVG